MSAFSTFWIDISCLCLCLTIHVIYRYRTKRLFPLPPGPSGWPIIGNALQLPLKKIYAFYEELGQKFGSKIIYVEALGQPIVVINDIDIAIDLLEKRSAIYSSRPRSMMYHDIMKSDHFFGFMEYGNEWRISRRLFQLHFSSKNLHRDQERLLAFVRKFLLPNIYEDSGSDSHKIDEHIESCIGAASLSMTYGLPVQRTNDPFVRSVADTLFKVSTALSAGKYLVNIIPILKYIPKWMPGATFKRDAREMRIELDRLADVPFDKVLQSMVEGTASVSFVSASIEDNKHLPDFKAREITIKHVASQIFGAAYETTAKSIRTFILVMVLHNEIQRKAQEEIDAIVGSDQLPSFSDWEQLPYLSSVLKEVFRWNPITPLGLAHYTTADDVYEGYYIPKGSVVMANVHAILHNEEEFENPEEFIPERFMKDGALRTDVLDPFSIATFGFGRRICPGSHIGLSMLYITAVSILSLYDIKPALDSNGKPIEVKPAFTTDSINSGPLPFEYRITPRQGKNIESLLRDYMGTDVL